MRTVLLTGATGFLGRYLVLEWLKRMELVDGRLICLVRANSDEEARRRVDKTFDSGDPQLLGHFPGTGRRSSAGHRRRQGRGQPGPGPAELAAAGRHRRSDRRFLHVCVDCQRGGSDRAVGVHRGCRHPGHQPTRTIDGSYVNGYGTSKWAGEVLLREAHDLCGLPVAVFRCDMILADTAYAGQLNVSDLFARMVLSLVATGIAHGSFYRLDAAGNRQRAHFDGLPVGFIAEAITTLGAQVVDGFDS